MSTSTPTSLPADLLIHLTTTLSTLPHPHTLPAYAPELLPDLSTFTSQHITYLFQILSQKWSPPSDDPSHLHALESRVFGALAKIILDARAAAQQYEDLRSAYEELQERVNLVVELLKGGGGGMVGGSGTPEQQIQSLTHSLRTSQETNAALRKIVTSLRSSNPPDVSEILTETQRRNAELLREVAALKAEGKQKQKQRGREHPQCTALANSFKDLAEYQVLPFLPDYSDRWFCEEWAGLFRRIQEWVDTGYSSGAGKIDEEGLFMAYTQMVLEGVDVRKLKIQDEEHRAMLCVAIIYRVLHEEVFEALHRFLTISIPSSPVGKKRKLDDSTELDTRKHINCHTLVEPETTDSTGTPQTHPHSSPPSQKPPNTSSRSRTTLYVPTSSTGAPKSSTQSLTPSRHFAHHPQADREEYRTVLAGREWVTVRPGVVKGGTLLVERRAVGVGVFKVGEEVERQMQKELGGGLTMDTANVSNLLGFKNLKLIFYQTPAPSNTQVPANSTFAPTAGPGYILLLPIRLPFKENRIALFRPAENIGSYGLTDEKAFGSPSQKSPHSSSVPAVIDSVPNRSDRPPSNLQICSPTSTDIFPGDGYLQTSKDSRQLSRNCGRRDRPDRHRIRNTGYCAINSGAIGAKAELAKALLDAGALKYEPVPKHILGLPAPAANSGGIFPP
ncbi:hypothetical protein K440DRAFT_645284 [Wilcoxina mikolae CBS 423.85]|nr:hypothetical protein K440DRAFT_645284 [Wilcoxina mikolae CBS 423.85]